MHNPFRWIDYKFLSALAVLLALALLIFTGIEKNRQIDALIATSQESTHHVVTLTAEVDALTAQLAARDEQADADRQQAALRSQRLRAQIRAQSTTIQALLEFLKASGIAIPQQFISQLGGGATTNHPKVPRGPVARP